MTSTGPDDKPTWLLVAIVTGADAALRVRVWRELRKLGAVYLHSSVCLLPDQADVAHRVETLSRRVRDSGGKAQVLKTVLVDDAEEAKIRAEQSADRDTEYGEVVERTGEFLAEIDRETQRRRATYTEVEESEADLERFDRWLSSIVARDYFHASGRHNAEEAIQRCRDALAAFEAAAVAADTDTNSASSRQHSGADQPEFHAAWRQAMELVKVAVGVALALILAWAALLLTLLAARPNKNTVTESLRLLPDLVRLVTRLAKDRSQPRGVRIRIALLLAYLACPIDLVPDFVPVLGYADDVIIVLLTLRSVIRLVGETPLRKHWPGTPAGLDAIVKLTQASRQRG